MPAIRMRSSPHLIRLGGGLSHGSTAFFGQTTNDLTHTLHLMQAAEAMHKLANGEPDTYIAFWKTHEKDYTGSVLHDQMAAYATQAQKKLDTDKADGAAYASYARTNNHQKFLDYLLQRREAETNPAAIAALDAHIDTMRGRVFNGGSTVVGGGYTVQDLKDAREEFSQAKIDAKESLALGPLSAGQLTRLRKAGEELDKIVTAAYESNKTTLKKSSLLGEAEAARAAYPQFLEQSDMQATKKGEKTNFPMDVAGQRAFKASLAGKPVADQIKAWGDRIAELNAATPTVQSAKVVSALTTLTHESETGADAAYKAGATPSKDETKEQQADQKTAYDKYRAWADTKHAADATFKVATPEEFRAAVLYDTPEQQKAVLGGGDPTFAINAKTKAAFEGYQPAVWSYTKGKFEGDPDSVAAAEATVESVQARSQVPGSSYYGVTGSKGELYDVASGAITPQALQQQRQGELQQHQAIQPQRAGEQGGGQLSAMQDLSQRQGEQGMAAPLGTQEQRQGEQNAGAQAAASNGPRPSLDSLTPDSVNDHMNTMSSAADEYLNKPDIPSLPDWKPSEEEQNKTPDWNSLFPFSTTGAGNPAEAPQPTGQEKAY